jgi:hypothetical protein
MTAPEIGNRLITMYRNGKIEEAKEKLFAPDSWNSDLQMKGEPARQTANYVCIRQVAERSFPNSFLLSRGRRVDF